MKDEELKEKLTPEQYRVMREKGEEKPFTGKFWDHEEEGTYKCPACGKELFSSESKFDSGTGWPSFKEALDEKNLVVNGGEVSCAGCGSNLGKEGNFNGEKYFRMNSAALEFEEAEEDEEEEEEEEKEEKKETKKNSGRSNGLQSPFSALTTFLGGTAVGAAVGVAAALLIAQNPPANDTKLDCPAPVVTAPAAVPYCKPLPAPECPTPANAAGTRAPSAYDTNAAGIPVATPSEPSSGSAGGTASAIDSVPPRDDSGAGEP